ncbi:MAG TPA: hypothetical protein VFE47_28275 [Tepidisphaeraceae bacterium]|jgi:hypothetical protein|nr:hypothetical protein [Tepidisphaeraceae bacterium]
MKNSWFKNVGNRIVTVWHFIVAKDHMKRDAADIHSCLPHPIAINKRHTAAGKPPTIVRDWITLKSSLVL